MRPCVQPPPPPFPPTYGGEGNHGGPVGKDLGGPQALPAGGGRGAPEHTQARWARSRQCRGRMQEPAATARGVVPTGAGATSRCCGRRGRYCLGLEPSLSTPPPPRPRPPLHGRHGPRPVASAGRRYQAAAAAARPCRSLPDGPSGGESPRLAAISLAACAALAAPQVLVPAGLAARARPGRPASGGGVSSAPGACAIRQGVPRARGANCAQNAGPPARALAQSAAKGARGCRAAPKRSDLVRTSVGAPLPPRRPGRAAAGAAGAAAGVGAAARARACLNSTDSGLIYALSQAHRYDTRIRQRCLLLRARGGRRARLRRGCGVWKIHHGSTFPQTDTF